MQGTERGQSSLSNASVPDEQEEHHCQLQHRPDGAEKYQKELADRARAAKLVEELKRGKVLGRPAPNTSRGQGHF